MKSAFHIVAVGTVALAASTAQAQPAPQERGGLITESAAALPSQGEKFSMRASELEAFQGQFQMRDGTTLTVTRKNRRLFVEVPGQREEELIAISRHAFIGANSAVRLVFQQADNGSVFGVEMHRTGRAA